MMQASEATIGSTASLVPNELTVNVITSLKELMAVAREWDTFVEDCGSDIYFTTIWLETWWMCCIAEGGMRGITRRAGMVGTGEVEWWHGGSIS